MFSMFCLHSLKCFQFKQEDKSKLHVEKARILVEHGADVNVKDLVGDCLEGLFYIVLSSYRFWETHCIFFH